jgi:hypothetical protein
LYKAARSLLPESTSERTRMRFCAFCDGRQCLWPSQNRSFATNNGRLRVSEDAFESAFLACSVAVVGMKIAFVVMERERKMRV